MIESDKAVMKSLFQKYQNRFGYIINYSIKLTITNTPNTLAKWKAYEQTDKLEKLVECCSSSKKGENT